MTDDVMNQIRAARQESDAIAGADMEPAAMRRAVAVLSKHLAELERDAETAQTEARQRSIERAEALKRELNRAAEVAGEYIDAARALPDDIAGTDFARRLLDDAIAGRPEACDDYDIATAAHWAITHVRSCQWEAIGMGLALEAIGAATEILPEGCYRQEIVNQAEAMMLLYNRDPLALYKKMKAFDTANKKEQKKVLSAIGAAAIEGVTHQLKEAKAQAGSYLTITTAAKATARRGIFMIKELNDMKYSAIRETIRQRFSRDQVPHKARGKTYFYERVPAEKALFALCRERYPTLTDYVVQDIRDVIAVSAVTDV